MSLFSNPRGYMQSILNMAATYDATDDQIVQNMLSLCGNAGQEAIIKEGSNEFMVWAVHAVNDHDTNPPQGSMEDFVKPAIGDEKWGATSEIWYEGEQSIEVIIDVFNAIGASSWNSLMD